MIPMMKKYAEMRPLRRQVLEQTYKKGDRTFSYCYWTELVFVVMLCG